ncbi:MAG UNVERIFIED_CONTAM: tetratricopeptide repeat protein [Anaerolineae bacterium]
MDEALTHFQQALTIKREVHDRLERRDPAQHWECVSGSGEVDEALTHFQQALTILREVHDRSGKARPCIILGVCI